MRGRMKLIVSRVINRLMMGASADFDSCVSTRYRSGFSTKRVSETTAAAWP
jgi:hypothetical protein